MLTRVSKAMVSGGDGDPILIVAAGQSNMIGWYKNAVTTSVNGPLYALDETYIFDTGTQGFRPVDLTSNIYQIYNADPDPSGVKTIGDGRNNLAIGFAARLRKEYPGRPVYIVFNATGGRLSDFWIGNGRNSVDWVALNSDLVKAFAILGTNTVDFFLWQQGEADAIANKTVGRYTTRLGTLRDQMRAESWWTANSVFLIGEPGRGWDDATSRDYLLSEQAAFAALGYRDVGLARSYGGQGGVNNIFGWGQGSDKIHYSGASLYSLGYYRYWDALPARFPKKSFKQLWEEFPWNAAGETKYPTTGVAFSRNAHLATAPLYTLAPTVAKVGSRLFVGATTNINNAGESGGSAARLVWSDDDGVTWSGDTAAGAGIGFTRSGGNVQEPCVWTAPDGKLWIFMVSSSDAAFVNDGRHGVYLSVIENPAFGSDIPATPNPTLVVPFGWCQKPEYINGKWYLPVSFWQATEAYNSGLANFVPYLQGRHYFEIDWINRKLVWGFHMADIDPGHQFDESSMTPLADGSFLGTWRTLDGPRRSYSLDSGKSWSGVAAFAGMGTQAGLTAAVSRHKTMTGPAGLILFAWNNAQFRTALTVALSNGTSGVGNIDPSGTRRKVVVAGDASYPDMLIDGDNCYLVCDDGFGTTTSRSASRRIRMFKFSLNALRTNAAGMTITERTTPIKGT